MAKAKARKSTEAKGEKIILPWIDTRTDDDGSLIRATLSVSKAGYPYLAIQVLPAKGRPRSHLINGETEVLRERFSGMVDHLKTLSAKKDTA